MPAPAGAELQKALLEIRQAAERVKAYEAELIERLQTAIRTHAAAIGGADGLAADAKAQCERIVAQGTAVLACIDRARQYPAQIVARADVLDRAGMLARMIRDLQAGLGRPPSS